MREKLRAKPIPGETVERRILLIRGQRVMLDSDLAQLYAVSTKRLNEQVKRNRDRFPALIERGDAELFKMLMDSPALARPELEPAQRLSACLEGCRGLAERHRGRARHLVDQMECCGSHCQRAGLPRHSLGFVESHQ